jgi:hypothetical protein
MTPNIKVILEQCIETGIARGIRRAHKHIDNPGIDVLTHEIDKSIWEEIHTYFDFPPCNDAVT